MVLYRKLAFDGTAAPVLKSFGCSRKELPEKRLLLTAHYPLWQINRIGKVVCRSHIENLAAKATAGEDAEFVRD